VQTEFKFIIPAKTVSPFALVSGLLSPVSAAVLNEAVSESNSPSNPNFSPAFSWIILPILAVSALIVLATLFSKIVTSSGLWSSKVFILAFALLLPMFGILRQWHKTTLRQHLRDIRQWQMLR
jgi:hypothetical protein